LHVKKKNLTDVILFFMLSYFLVKILIK